MKYNIQILLRSFIPVVLLVMLIAACKRERPFVEYGFECYVNGEKYAPSYFTNTVQVEILGDSILLLTANEGYRALGMGLRKVLMKPQSFVLTESVPYSNSADYMDGEIYRIKNFHLGKASITEVNKQAKTMRGTFSFSAYTNDNTDSVVITKGRFWLPYRSF